MTIEQVHVIGARGRVGSAVAARLSERGVVLGADEPDIVLLCVPDRAIPEVAAAIATGSWIAHVSGATPLAALDPHRRRFSLHPLQTFTHARGPEQLDGAFAAVTAETDDARTVAHELASLLGLTPFELADDRRVLYHAGAVMAGNYLVTLRRAGGALLTAAGAPPEALEPLMRRVIDNDFALTGPIDRGDWETVERHLAALHDEQPELIEAYEALLHLTARQLGTVPAGAVPRRTRSQTDPDRTPTAAGLEVCRTVAGLRAALATRRGGTIGLVPTMGALHAGHRALLDAARADCDTVVLSLFVNPSQFSDAADLNGYPRDEQGDLAAAADAGVDVVFAPDAAELYPPGYQTWVDVAELGSILEGIHRPGHFRGVATVCLKLLTIVRPDRAYFGQKDAQQVEVVRRMTRDLHLETAIAVVPTVRDADGLALSSRNQGLSAADRARALALPRALATGDPDAARRTLVEAGLDPEYVVVAPFDPPVLAAAVRVGDVRLIDNAPVKEIR